MIVYVHSFLCFFTAGIRICDDSWKKIDAVRKLLRLHDSDRILIFSICLNQARVCKKKERESREGSIHEDPQQSL